MLDKGITIIVPVYNTEYALFEDCINSILNQSYKNFELFIINDGSSRINSTKYKKFLKCLKNDKIKYIENDNNGVSYSRNLGIRLATKKYITFIDSDDIIREEFLEKSIDFLEKNNLDGVLAGVRKQYSNSYEDFSIKSKKFVIYKENEMNLLLNKTIAYETKETININNCFFSGCVSKIFKTEIVKNLNFNNNLSIGEDVIFNIDYLSKCKNFGIIDYIGYIYILRDNSAVTGYRENLILESVNLFQEMRKRIDSDNINYFYYRVLKQFNWIMYGMIFHKNSNLNIFEKYLKIRELYKIDIFNESIKKMDIKTLLLKPSYKLMYILLKYRLFILLLFIFELNSFWRSKK